MHIIYNTESEITELYRTVHVIARAVHRATHFGAFQFLPVLNIAGSTYVSTLTSSFIVQPRRQVCGRKFR